MQLYIRNFKLGAYYALGRGPNARLFQFIQVTTKGFNLLELKTNKCLFRKKHLYSRNWYNKEIPNCFEDVKNVWVPEYFVFVEIKNDQELQKYLKGIQECANG